MGDQIAQVVIMIIYAIIKSYLHFGDLNNCLVPLGYWLLIYWIDLFCMVFVFVGSNGGRGDTLGLVLVLTVVFYVVWGFIGMVSFGIILVKDEQCIPKSLYGEAIFFMIVNFLIQVCVLILFCKDGISRLWRTAVGRENAERNLQGILEGNIRANDLIGGSSQVDEYALFDTEKDSLVDKCAFYYQANQQIGQNNEADCVICYSSFEDGDRVIRFPMCNHEYHKDCLMEWLRNRTTCPMCRRGVRSSLYEFLERNQANPQPQPEGPIPQNQRGTDQVQNYQPQGLNEPRAVHELVQYRVHNDGLNHGINGRPLMGQQQANHIGYQRLDYLNRPEGRGDYRVVFN